MASAAQNERVVFARLSTVLVFDDVVPFQRLASRKALFKGQAQLAVAVAVLLHQLPMLSSSLALVAVGLRYPTNEPIALPADDFAVVRTFWREFNRVVPDCPAVLTACSNLFGHGR